MLCPAKGGHPLQVKFVQVEDWITCLAGDDSHKGQDNSMAPKVLISDSLSPAAVQIFKDRGIEVDFQPKLGADKEKLAEIIGNYDGLAIRSATKVSPKILEKATKPMTYGPR